MKGRIGHWCWLALVMLTGVVAPLHAQATSTAAVTRVEIESFWGGLNPDAPFRTVLVIEQTADGYRWSGTESKSRGDREKKQTYPGGAVPANAVERLREAMTAAPRARVDLQTLQPAIADVQALIDHQFAELRESNSDNAALDARSLQALRDQLRHADTLADVLTDGFGEHHFDDYPHVGIDMTLADGTKLTAGSGAQQALMLPWQTASGALTYAVDLPKAVAALLPAEATNRERLDGAVDESWLEALLRAGLAPRFSRLQVQSNAPDALRALSAQLKVTEVSLVSLNGPQIDATMHLQGGPSNLQVDARLPLAGTRLKDETSAVHLRQMLELVASSPALQKRMLQYPQRDFRVRYGYIAAWPSKKLVKQFIDQMQAMNKLAALGTSAPSLHDAVMVEEGQSPIYWVVLPDRRAVWWKEFDASENATDGMRCASTPSNYDEDDEEESDAPLNDLCRGLIYQADGSLP